MLRRVAIWVLVAACSKGPLDSERAQLDEAARLEAAAKLDKLVPAARDFATTKTKTLHGAVQKLAAIPELAEAIKASSAERQSKASVAFMKFRAASTEAPDVLALVDVDGNVLAVHETPSPVPAMFRGETTKTVFPALDLVLSSKTSIADTVVWNAPYWIGAATVVEGEQPLGAVVVLHAMRATKSKHDATKLGAELGYAAGNKVFVTTLGEHALTGSLSQWLADKPASSAAFATGSAVGDPRYVVRVVEIPRASATPVPAGYPVSPVSLLVFGKVTGLLEP
jgi:hypothetical protein